MENKAKSIKSPTPSLLRLESGGLKRGGKGEEEKIKGGKAKVK